jgi:hypothetical protein
VWPPPPSPTGSSTVSAPDAQLALRGRQQHVDGRRSDRGTTPEGRITATQPSAIDVTRDLLKAADTDIAAFFATFTDDCHFRMGNAEVVVGRENIQAWVRSNWIETTVPFGGVAIGGASSSLAP